MEVSESPLSSVEQDILRRRKDRENLLNKYGLKEPDADFVDSLFKTLEIHQDEKVKETGLFGSEGVKISFAGLLGGFAANIAILLTFRLIGFGQTGGGILLDPGLQSEKLIAVWTQIEPLPIAMQNPLLFSLGIILFSLGHAAFYHWLSPSWPEGVLSRGLRLALLVFFFSYLFFEFFTPINMLGEPLLLVAVELVFWAFVALSESLTIALVLEKWKESIALSV